MPSHENSLRSFDLRLFSWLEIAIRTPEYFAKQNVFGGFSVVQRRNKSTVGIFISSKRRSNL